MEDFLIVGGLILGQMLCSAWTVLLGLLLAKGFDPLFIVVLNSFTTFIILAPFAFFLERGKRPSVFSVRLLLKFVSLSLGGITVCQALMMIGIKKTTPAIASAMPNLVPGLVFLIAAILRMEKVDLKCRYSWFKIVGTLLCLCGTLMAMSFFRRSTAASHPSHHRISAANHVASVLGCVYLLVGVFLASCIMILEAATLVEYPAPMSLSAITSLMGSAFTAALQLLQEHNLGPGSSSLSLPALFGVVFVGGLANAMFVSIQGWSVKKRGPVLVSMFSPVGTVSSAILSCIILGDSLRMGSILGMGLIFIGLYVVLWAKNKEGYADVADDNERDLLESQDVNKSLIP